MCHVFSQNINCTYLHTQAPFMWHLRYDRKFDIMVQEGVLLERALRVTPRSCSPRRNQPGPSWCKVCSSNSTSSTATWWQWPVIGPLHPLPPHEACGWWHTMVQSCPRLEWGGTSLASSSSALASYWTASQVPRGVLLEAHTSPSTGPAFYLCTVGI